MKYCLKQSQINLEIHEVLSGPYASESECLGGCDQSSSSTSESSSSSSGPCTLTSGTIQPPIISATTMFNPNDFQVQSFVERSTDNGSTWNPAFAQIIGPNSSYPYNFFSAGGQYRARCVSTGEGDSVSAWSFNYDYPNVCFIQPPIISATTMFNPNDFQVQSFVERSTDNGSTWNPVFAQIIGPNSSYPYNFFSAGGQYRVRCASTGEGDSVSAWSFNYDYPNPENIQPPIISATTMFNPNDFQVQSFVERSTDNGSTWNPVFAQIIGPNSSYPYNFFSAGGQYRARCASTGEGDSVSAWSS